MGPLRLRYWHLLIGGLCAQAIYEHHYVPPAEGEPKTALLEIGLVLLSIGLSLLAAKLLAPDTDSMLKDDKPTTLAKRGAWITWHMGIRRVGPIFTWAGNRRKTKEEVEGGKKGIGGDDPEITIWRENGWHVLAVGPCYALHRILQSGKPIFDGPITKDSHPSGSYIDLGNEGGFRIYWGEPDQDVNTWLGDANRVGVSSRWPYHCYVVWDDKRLGPAAVWPLLDYELEKRPVNTFLSQTDPIIESDFALTGETVDIFDVDTSGPTDKFILKGAHADIMPADTVVRLTGNALSDRDLTVLYSELFAVHLGGFIFTIRTRVHFTDGALTGADDNGTLQAYEFTTSPGINGAHAIASMIFDTWPQGLGLPTVPTDRFAFFDLDSLEDLGTLIGPAGENLKTSWLAKNGETVTQILGTGLQDLGVMMPMDPASGLIIFQPLREPTGTLPRIRDDLLVGKLPEVETLHGDQPTDRLTFSFPDRDLTDRDATIAVMEDGQVSRLETQHAKNVQITITTDFPTASKIAQRRSQEELAGGAAIRLQTNRATRTLIPGQALTVDALSEVMRVVSVGLDTEANEVELTLMADIFGVPLTPFTDDQPPDTGNIKPVDPDLLKTVLEVPEYELGADAQTVIVPRIRAHDQIGFAWVHISRDNVTYKVQDRETDLHTGGLANEAIPDDGLMLLENGPTFEALGPDISIVQDLTGDLTNWRLGRQICVISSSAGTEFCFLRNITAQGGDTWRLDGLIRARWDTEMLDHPAGAKIFIFDRDDILRVQDILLEPNEDLYAKTQPVAGGTLPLESDAPVGLVLYGKAKAGRPVPIGGLTVTAPDLVNAYGTGQDVTVRWDYGTPQTPSTGAGLQGAGTPISSYPSPDEDFQLEILTLADVVQHTEFPTTNTATFTNTEIQTYLGSELSFKVRVRQRRGGLLSDAKTIIVEKI